MSNHVATFSPDPSPERGHRALIGTAQTQPEKDGRSPGPGQGALWESLSPPAPLGEICAQQMTPFALALAWLTSKEWHKRKCLQGSPRPVSCAGPQLSPLRGPHARQLRDPEGRSDQQPSSRGSRGSWDIKTTQTQWDRATAHLEGVGASRRSGHRGPSKGKVQGHSDGSLPGTAPGSRGQLRSSAGIRPREQKGIGHQRVRRGFKMSSR